MKQVTIRRCPECSNIGNLTNSVSAALKKERDVNVQVVDGEKGEFTLEVDGRKVSGMTGEMLPTTDQVVQAVRGEVGSAV